MISMLSNADIAQDNIAEGNSAWTTLTNSIKALTQPTSIFYFILFLIIERLKKDHGMKMCQKLNNFLTK